MKTIKNNLRFKSIIYFLINVIHTRNLKILFLAGGLFSISVTAIAQDTTQTTNNQNLISEKSGVTKGLITGGAFIDFSINRKNDAKTNFYRTGFSPIFLWKI